MFAHDTAEDPLDRDVDWVVTARSTPPMLPLLRGGELVLLPRRVVSESALNLRLLIQELTSQPVAGVVLDTDEPVESLLPVLRAQRIGAELESDLNRMLTTRRGDLLRTGTDIERIVAMQRGAHASPEELLRALADHLHAELAVRTTGGTPLVSTTEQLPSSLLAATDAGWLERPLRRNRVLMIGGLTPETRALGRYVLGRLADAVQAALDEEASTVQDLATRTRLINQALATASHDPQGASGMLRRAGIPQDAPFRVAAAPAGSAEADVWPLLRTLGTPVDAGTHRGGPAWLLTGGSTGQRAAATADAWIAVSGPVRSAADLGAAMRQIAFLCGIRQGGAIDGGVVRFDDVVSLGVMRLLYELWGTSLLDDFVATMIGGLIREDRRGLLRETLRRYLAFGGTQRPTAESLGIHRNTLTYRLRQIRALLDVDPDDPAARLNLHVALVASELPPATTG